MSDAEAERWLREEVLPRLARAGVRVVPRPSDQLLANMKRVAYCLAPPNGNEFRQWLASFDESLQQGEAIPVIVNTSEDDRVHVGFVDRQDGQVVSGVWVAVP